MIRHAELSVSPYDDDLKMRGESACSHFACRRGEIQGIKRAPNNLRDRGAELHAQIMPLLNTEGRTG